MSRPKGYADWNPALKSIELIDNVKAVLNEYRDHLPMTARQIFYRLVGAYDYDKTERAYANLCEALVRARRAQVIPFEVIRDDGTASYGGDFGYADPDAFWRELRESGQNYQRLTREGQPVRVELWCEAAGMAPQLARVARDFGISTYTTGGFSSVTVTHEIAMRALKSELPTIFLHVGDFDPSGESIFDAMSIDALCFVAGHLNGDAHAGADRFRAERVALTAEQVEEHDLPTAPPKSTDSRSANWGEETCQAEAMPPDLLAGIVREACEQYIDQDILDDVLARERVEREEITGRLDEVIED